MQMFAVIVACSRSPEDTRASAQHRPGDLVSEGHVRSLPSSLTCHRPVGRACRRRTVLAMSGSTFRVQQRIVS
jgi:hypothetical protein